MTSDDMFFDDAHLNTKNDIPFIVKFLKRVLNIFEESIVDLTVAEFL
jgi:hypothetical protein